jgi:16S rRNA (guanine527-N7)-methyltransferase
VAESLGLKNVRTIHARAEDIKGEFDFIVSRAVTAMPTFVGWVKHKVAKKQNNELKNGILYLKGGDLVDELQIFRTTTVYNLSDFFKEDFFDTKKVVHLPIKYKG